MQEERRVEDPFSSGAERKKVAVTKRGGLLVICHEKPTYLEINPSLTILAERRAHSMPAKGAWTVRMESTVRTTFRWS